MGGNDKNVVRRLVVNNVVDETADTRSFELVCEDGPLDYKAGQFLTILFKGITGHEVRRSYSFSSAPEVDEKVTVTVKRVANGEFSRFMFDKVRKGSILKTIGASGLFVLPQKATVPGRLIFVAAGSGITPVFSLMKSALQRFPSTKILLIYSNRNVANTIFYKQLEMLRERHRDLLQIQYLFSEERDIKKSRLTPEILEALMDEYKISDFDSTSFYICGPNDYMRMATYTLMNLGVPQANIKKEIFFVQPLAVTPVPPDTDAHNVFLLSGNEEYTFSVQYPVSILQTAKLLNIPVPYSCENGQCGTCVAECLQGEVWMSRNEVLLEEEIKRGIALTCTGFPVNGDVKIKI